MVGEGIDFAWSFAVHVPLAREVAFLLEHAQHGVDGAGAQVYAEVLSYFGYDLVPVHGFIF